MQPTASLVSTIVRGPKLLCLLPMPAAAVLALGWGARSDLPWVLVWCAALLACLVALGAAWRGGLGLWEALMAQAGALAAATGALALPSWHYLAKPAAMVFAITAVAADASRTRESGRFVLNPLHAWLLLALGASLAGDVFLMLPERFIPGLVSFLLAHLAYLALFRLGSRWLAQRAALAATLVLGAGVYAFLWQGGLPPELRLPVAVYVLAIALMAAQAWARWQTLRGPAPLCVALGACCFMFSDTLLATDLFVQPLPWAPLWVLASYYVAQLLIVAGVLRSAEQAGA
ncbi:lysoplasmalogenase [Comamonas sp. NLF-1-9]|uniref:lysoplasmalogenase n=1 Tax=Comamonas sp. NLF-1-9 TaxID=2853163 RepID=UPI001C44BDCB|nr:lysoplasmalogenase [Comamonas sp. NLF-1-9]QXL84346.1 lysoplasmalogenase [Comamonas sp. NLF-1-9]